MGFSIINHPAMGVPPLMESPMLLDAPAEGVGHLHQHGGFPTMGVPPKNAWFLLGKIPLKWMMTGGTPISGNLH